MEESWEHTKKTKEQSFKGRKDIIVKEELWESDEIWQRRVNGNL